MIFSVKHAVANTQLTIIVLNKIPMVSWLYLAADAAPEADVGKKIQFQSTLNPT